MLDSTLEMRKCKTCGQEKLLTVENFRFYVRGNSRYFDHQCKKCGNANTAKWWRENAEAARAKDRQEYRADLQKSRARSLGKYYRNIEVNREKGKLSKRRWRAANTLESRERVREYKARRRGAQTEPIRRKDIDALHDKQRGRCAICMRKLNGKWHVDHIIPLKKGGAHELKNLQLACAVCNIQKRDSHPIDHMQKLGFLL